MAQVGSQYWMNTGYSGPEPSLATKAVFSSASYASSWAAQDVTNMQKAGVPGVNTGSLAAIASNPVSVQAQALWAAFPGVAPPTNFTTVATPGVGAGTPIINTALQLQVPPGTSTTSGSNAAPVATGTTTTQGNNIGNSQGTNGQTSAPVTQGTVAPDLFAGLNTLLSNPTVILAGLAMVALLALGPGISRSFSSMS